MQQRLKAERARREAMGPDHSQFIWDELFRVRVPMVASRGINDIRRRGVLLSGIKELDDDIMNRTIITFATIDRMVEWYREGVAIGVCNPADTKIIYTHISNHIKAWKHQLERGINIGNAPIEDLVLMDEFAHTVYEHAKYEFKGEVIDSIIAQHFKDVQPIGPNEFFNPNALRKLRLLDVDGGVKYNANGDVVINGSDNEGKPEDRESYADFFKERMINFSRS